MKKLIVIDIETTGLNVDFNEIIEIGVTEIIDGEIGKSFNRMVRPKQIISEEIIKLTGITNEMVKDAKSIEQILPKLREYLGDNLILAHNAKFDMKFLNKAFISLDLKPITNYECTMELLKSHINYMGENYKLETACKYYGIINDNAHRASSDTKATAELYIAIKSEMLF